MKVTSNNGPRVLPPEGPAILILVGMVDWGTQASDFGPRRVFEIVCECAEHWHEFQQGEGEKPLLVTRKFGHTIGRGSKLKEFIEQATGASVEGEEINIEDYLMLGMMFRAQLVYDPTEQYANIQSAMRLTDAEYDSYEAAGYAPFNELVLLDLDNYDQAMYDLLPDWKQKEIANSPEYKEVVGAQARTAHSAVARATAAPGRAATGPVRRPAPVAQATPEPVAEIYDDGQGGFTDAQGNPVDENGYLIEVADELDQTFSREPGQVAQAAAPAPQPRRPVPPAKPAATAAPTRRPAAPVKTAAPAPARRAAPTKPAAAPAPARRPAAPAKRATPPAKGRR